MNFLHILFAVALIPTLSGFAAEKPNILFVLFDDMGYGEPTAYRSASLFRTPNIDLYGQGGDTFY